MQKMEKHTIMCGAINNIRFTVTCPVCQNTAQSEIIEENIPFFTCNSCQRNIILSMIPPTLWRYNLLKTTQNYFKMAIR